MYGYGGMPFGVFGGGSGSIARLNMGGQLVKGTVVELEFFKTSMVMGHLITMELISVITEVQESIL